MMQKLSLSLLPLVITCAFTAATQASERNNIPDEEAQNPYYRQVSSPICECFDCSRAQGTYYQPPRPGAFIPYPMSQSQDISGVLARIEQGMRTLEQNQYQILDNQKLLFDKLSTIETIVAGTNGEGGEDKGENSESLHATFVFPMGSLDIPSNPSQTKKRRNNESGKAGSGAGDDTAGPPQKRNKIDTSPTKNSY